MTPWTESQWLECADPVAMLDHAVALQLDVRRIVWAAASCVRECCVVLSETEQTEAVAIVDLVSRWAIGGAWSLMELMDAEERAGAKELSRGLHTTERHAWSAVYYVVPLGGQPRELADDRQTHLVSRKAVVAALRANPAADYYGALIREPLPWSLVCEAQARRAA